MLGIGKGSLWNRYMADTRDWSALLVRQLLHQHCMASNGKTGHRRSCTSPRQANSPCRNHVYNSLPRNPLFSANVRIPIHDYPFFHCFSYFNPCTMYVQCKSGYKKLWQWPSDVPTLRCKTAPPIKTVGGPLVLQVPQICFIYWIYMSDEDVK